MINSGRHEQLGGHKAKGAGGREDIVRALPYVKETKRYHKYQKRAAIESSQAKRLQQVLDLSENIRPILRDVAKYQRWKTDAGSQLLSQGYKEDNLEGMPGFTLNALVGKNGTIPRNGVIGYLTAPSTRHEVVIAANGNRDPETGERLFSFYIKNS